MTTGTRPRSSKRTSMEGGYLRGGSSPAPSDCDRPPAGSAWRGRLREVPAEHAVDDRLRRHDAQQQRQHARRQRGDQALQAQGSPERALMTGAERSVARERLLAGVLAGEDTAQLAPSGDAEVKRGADPLAAEREAVPGAVAAEEHPVLCGGSQTVREPVALPALGLRTEALRERLGRLAHMVARLIGAHADALLLPRRNAPGEAAGRQRTVDPDVERAVSGAGVRMDLEAAAQRRVGWLVAGRGEHPAPPERIHDQRRVQIAAVGVDGEARAPVDLRRLEPGVALGEEVLAEGPVVEGRPAPRQPVANRAVR